LAFTSRAIIWMLSSNLNLMTCCRSFAFLLILFFLSTPTLRSQSKETKLQTLLIQQLRLSDPDMAAIAQGRVIAKILSAKDKREIVALGMIRVNVSQEEFLKRYRDIGSFKQGPEVLQLGKFSNPAKLSDIQGLTLESGDIDDLKSCRIGSCGLKLSSEMINRLTASLLQAKDVKESTNGALREVLVDYVNKYMQQGDSALATYNETKRPLSVAEDFKSLLQGTVLLQSYAPELVRYLQAFPKGELPNTESFVYWSKEKFGLKPVISLTHVLIYQRNINGHKELIIVTKQLYADHYFDSSVGVAILAEEPANSKLPGTYLIYLNQTRADALRGFLTGLRRSVVESKSLSALKNNLKLLKQRLEQPVAR
jgi:hypothetical protein